MESKQPVLRPFAPLGERPHNKASNQAGNYGEDLKERDTRKKGGCCIGGFRNLACRDLHLPLRE